ncbi:MAG: stage 0 sporulation protein [Endomicrobia bacterium]|nr:stage 0 sporulation protein [Endomicrobiia bacterium]
MQQKLIVDVLLETGDIAFGENVNGIDIKNSDKVIIQVDNSYELAEIISNERLVNETQIKKEEIFKIVRKITDNDLPRIRENRIKSEEAYKIVKQACLDYELPIKISFAKYSFDKSKLYIYYVQEKPCNLGKVIQELAHRFKSRIVMKQIGPRDETKLVGGIGGCGYELCCKKWIKKFESISVEMAKTQQLSLNIPKLSGLCNRLKCCLFYEYDFYKECVEKLPKIGTTVKTKEGEGRVVSIDCIKEKVNVEFTTQDGDTTIKTFSIKDIY